MNAIDLASTVVKHFEGCRLKVYLDPANKMTVGYGHLVLPKDGFALNDTITQWEADDFLREDLQTALDGVFDLVIEPLHPLQVAALISFVYNLGTAQFASSTLLKKINSGEVNSASYEFKRWIFAGGKALEGLARRRDCEAGLWVAGLAMTNEWHGPHVV